MGSKERLLQKQWARVIVPCILVDDHSSDGSGDFLKQLYQDCPSVQVMPSTQKQGKKGALRTGVQAAQTQYVWFADSDVELPLALLDRSILTSFSWQKDMYILPLQMAKPLAVKGWARLLCALQETEYVALQSLTIKSAEAGHPVLCSGANLIAKRDLWLNSYEDLQLKVPSGDDMFLLESFKRKNYAIGAQFGEAWIGTIEPLESLKALLRQRMRWAGKAPRYHDKEIIGCGAMVVLANVLAVAVPLPCFVVKYLVDMALIGQGERFGLRLTHRWGKGLLLSLVYPWYLLISLLGGLFRQQKW